MDKLSMNAVQLSLLSMIRTSLWKEIISIEDGVTSNDLFNEACRYQIAGVLSNKLDIFCKNDIDTRKKWSTKAMNDYQKSYCILESQSSLIKILSQENIRPVFLKGMASAYYYPNSLLRQIGDIDFIVLPEQFDTCCKLLEENGYKKGLDGKRHLAFEKQGLKYECHRYFSMNKTKSDKLVDETIFAGCKNYVVHTIEGKEFYALPDAEYGIVLLEHLKHHFYDGVGFRQVMDWVLYVNAVLDNMAWFDKPGALIRKCGLERFAMVLTRTAQLYLGLRTDEISWCTNIEEESCSSALSMILASNNFGFVNENSEFVQAIGGATRTGFLKALDASAVVHIPISEKYVMLRPFAWIYQLVRWGLKGITGLIQNSKNLGLVSASKDWKTQRKMLNDIGLNDD